MLRQYLLDHETGGRIFLAVLFGMAVVVPISNLWVPADSFFHIPTYTVTLLGKYLCYALLAMALDLVWGYCGILSLGHGAFFALGGYAMGMYLMRQIGERGVYGHPELPDFMVFLNWDSSALVLVWVRSVLVCRVDGHVRTGNPGFCIRLAGIPLTSIGRIPVHHDTGVDLRPDAGVLSQ